MTEPEPSAHDERVRRLLADARHDAAMPADVASRLDGVLADLAAERDVVPPPPLGPPAPVVDLAARRRRRQGAALLVAAAAVVAIGVGVGTVVDGGSDGGPASAGGGQESFDRAPAERDTAAGGAEPDEAAPSDSAPDGLAAITPVPVSSDTFADDAERYRAISERRDKPGAQSEQGFACDPADFGPGVLLPVLYDGMAAVLAYRPPTDDAQVVDLVQCGTGDVVRTTTLPVP